MPPTFNDVRHRMQPWRVPRATQRPGNARHATHVVRNGRSGAAKAGANHCKSVKQGRSSMGAGAHTHTVTCALAPGVSRPAGHPTAHHTLRCTPQAQHGQAI